MLSPVRAGLAQQSLQLVTVTQDPKSPPAELRVGQRPGHFPTRTGRGRPGAQPKTVQPEAVSTSATAPSDGETHPAHPSPAARPAAAGGRREADADRRLRRSMHAG